MFAMITVMATKKDTAAFASALADLRASRPDLADRLGDDPARADLIDLVADLAPDVAAGARQMSRVSLIALVSAIAPAPEPVELVAFTTRLPADLVQEVKAEAVARGVSVQALVADALARGLAAGEA